MAKCVVLSYKQSYQPPLCVLCLNQHPECQRRFLVNVEASYSWGTTPAQVLRSEEFEQSKRRLGLPRLGQLTHSELVLSFNPASTQQSLTALPVQKDHWISSFLSG